jgi:methionyl-tRNA formyltransferase
MRVVFFGTPRFAVPTLDALVASRHRVVGVVTQPDRPHGRGQKVAPGPVKARVQELAQEPALPVAQPTTLAGPEIEATLRHWRPDIGVVVAYGLLIPRTLLTLPTHGLINVHASLLPTYRGAAPIHRAVMNGDDVTGVSIMRVAPKLDAGAVFAVTKCAIGPGESSVDVDNRLAHAGAALLLQVLDDIEGGRSVETPQDDTRATYAHKLTKAESPIDWTRPAAELHNKVRGLHPWPLASTTVAGARLIVHEAALAGPCPGVRPGEIARVDKDHLHVAAGDEHSLALLRVQPEGRRAMTIREFLAGATLRTGRLLSTG